MTLRGSLGLGGQPHTRCRRRLALTDSFGSWVYWNRIPLAAVDRIEVVRGATGDS